jgi:hypothetical protein
MVTLPRIDNGIPGSRVTKLNKHVDGTMVDPAWLRNDILLKLTRHIWFAGPWFQGKGSFARCHPL